uniref:Uncharacterized protein n=1 Tax=Brassica campestris TaxID=3711 RepID=A0A3P6AXC6_BRACM|nr:unnamed protein product [Brassica rapa]
MRNCVLRFRKRNGRLELVQVYKRVKVQEEKWPLITRLERAWNMR